MCIRDSKSPSQFQQHAVTCNTPQSPQKRGPGRKSVMRTALALLSLAAAARALSAYHSQRTHSLEAANYRAQASKLRKEAAILETELIKERKALEALREAENPKSADTPPPQPVLVAKAGAVEVRWALDDAGALKAKVAAGGATLDLEGSWRASDNTVTLAASGVLGVRVACEAPMMAAEGCLLYTSPSPRDRQKSRMPSSA